MKLLPYQDEAFSKYRMEGVQEFRFVLSGQIRPQVLNAIFVEKVETSIKSNVIINVLKVRIVNIQLLQKYLSEKSPFDIFVRVISEEEVRDMNLEEAVRTYSDMLYKICIVMLCNEQDAQDVIQETFCRYFEKAPVFTDTEHEKAWLIRVAANHCKDVMRFRFRHPQVPIDLLAESLVMEQEQQETLTELFELPVKQRTVIYLYYVEGYQMKEIAAILGISVQAVKKRMQRGREQLRVVWKEECCR